MLQGTRASTLTMPSFGHNLSLTGVQKMEGYGDVNPWNWHPEQSNPQAQTHPTVFDPTLYANFTSHAPQSIQNRHHSIATSHVSPLSTTTPPPPRPHIAGALVKAQPAFKPTWHGFLDTTKDAMTIVEAALQGRLSHISRRPHDKERAEMLTSGTILVYEENASGIKRWTDAVHWSPSRVMNNCLIYRQLVRALKPEEKRAALNPTSGGKRKRKESASPSITKTGENVNNSEDEYENPNLDGNLPGDTTPTTDSLGKVYANFAQKLSIDQQRRYCGSLIDSYEFKEGGLMKKTISVKYKGTHHHIISYYSLEDVVSGKLKRPYQDPKLAGILPRAELLTGWKVSLEDEEGKDMQLITGYPQQIQPGHIQHQVIGTGTQEMTTHDMVQSHAPLHLQLPTEYWQGGQAHQYTPTQQSSQHYSPSHHTSQYAPQQTTQSYPPQQPSPQNYTTQQASSQHFPQQPSSQPYSSQQASPQPYASQDPSPQHYSSQQPATQQYSTQPSSAQQFPSQPARTHSYTPQPQAAQHYPSEQHMAQAQQYTQQHLSSQYPTSHSTQTAPQDHYALSSSHVFDLQVHVPQVSTPAPHETQSPVLQHDSQRRASAPVALQPYGQPPHHATPQAQAFYMADQKYTAASGYGF
ncbi:hypothetical protein K505DRAFT_109623 [Melanomma pulvis-pyrius CBS 109.77]|uniref:Camp independent regulatory protein n=1 Tax=Melanomma pulvis-pyrius CBS 109.77 TaxID=1314802 RepID=A0A6A6WWF3_9PLEO|nr:hypothetical protein K505DRAFT_109623 [Melanomma pulvis-pyrius CBS 109.77]